MLGNKAPHDLALAVLLEFICLCSLLSPRPCHSVFLEHLHIVLLCPRPIWLAPSGHSALSSDILSLSLATLIQHLVLPKSFSSTLCHFIFSWNSFPSDLRVFVYSLPCIELMRSKDPIPCLTLPSWCARMCMNAWPMVSAQYIHTQTQTPSEKESVFGFLLNAVHGLFTLILTTTSFIRNYYYPWFYK